MRFCEPCERLVSQRECPACGADTVPVPKDELAGMKAALEALKR